MNFVRPDVLVPVDSAILIDLDPSAPSRVLLGPDRRTEIEAAVPALLPLRLDIAG